MATVLFHNDLDGVISAALLATSIKHYGDFPVDFSAVDHESNMDGWINGIPAAQPFWVVDFVYHPAAVWWYDHHPKPFLKEEWQLTYSRNGTLDSSVPSCARLIYSRLPELQVPRLEALVQAADYIDAAQYETPEAAYNIKNPVVALNNAYYLMTPGQRHDLARLLMFKDIDTVSARYYNLAMQADLANNRQIDRYPVKLTGRVAVTNLVQSPGIFVRFAPYIHYPKAQYSVQLYPRDREFCISIAQNPWMPSNDADLGAIARRYGGGGHTYAASIKCPSKAEATVITQQIVKELV